MKYKPKTLTYWIKNITNKEELMRIISKTSSEHPWNPSGRSIIEQEYDKYVAAYIRNKKLTELLKTNKNKK